MILIPTRFGEGSNQTRREIGSDIYDLKYDAENKLVEVKKNSARILKVHFI